MDFKKYEHLRKRIKDRDYESDNKGIKNVLKWFSYLGNIGSIFFAFFLVNPALQKTIEANLDAGDYTYTLSAIVTVVVLGGFELLKRLWLDKTSMDLIQEDFKPSTDSIRYGILAIIFICASFYLSLNGAIIFASTSEDENIAIENTTQVEIDSVTVLYQEQIQAYLDENSSLRESNSELRERISETPLNYRTVRKEYQDLIDANNSTIEANDARVSDLQGDRDTLIASLEQEQQEQQSANTEEDFSNILLFLLLSTSIEFIIIAGIYFEDKYDFKVFLLHSDKYEFDYKRKERYLKLLKFIYRDGKVHQGDRVIAISKLKTMLKENSSVASPNKLADDFYNDLQYHNIIKMVGRRWTANMSYDEAVKKIDNHDDGLKLLEEL